MVIRITGEHNFFLFQDIVYYFGLTLKFEWGYPIDNKYNCKDYRHRSTSEYIYNSWYELFIEKLKRCERTKYYHELIELFKSWMITTNIAITTAQKGRKREGIPSWELEMLTKYKPSFLIDHQDNYETYIVHLDEEIEIIFNEAILFYKTIEKDFNSQSFLTLLKRYFIIDEGYLSEELPVICDNFIGKKEYFMEDDIFLVEGD